MDIVHKISLDFGREQNPPHISVMQGDSAREIRISLYSNGVAWIPSGSESAYIAFETPSGNRKKILSLKDGTPVEAGRINVFVGANNCGKTQLLKDMLKKNFRWQPLFLISDSRRHGKLLKEH